MTLYTDPWPYCIVDDLVSETFTESLTHFISGLEHYRLYHFDQFQFPIEITDQYQLYRNNIIDQIDNIVGWFPHTQLTIFRLL
jgi:hypothetical protein